MESERAVKKEEGQAMAKKIDAIFYETSALNNINIEEVFRAIAKSLYKKIAERSVEGEHKRPTKESSETPQKAPPKDTS